MDLEKIIPENKDKNIYEKNLNTNKIEQNIDKLNIEISPINIQKYKETDTQSEIPYINCFFFNITVPILLAYFYLLSSILITSINRVIFGKIYKFYFNFTHFFIQQLFMAICLTFLSIKIKKIKDIIGEISLKDFLRFKYRYIIFNVIFTLNTLSSFISNRFVTNTAMFLILRKLAVVFNFLFDIFIEKKKISTIMALSMFFIVLGSIVSGIDDFTADYFGYLVVLINCFLKVFYNKISENFKKNTGVSSLKLLLYNSYLCVIVLFFLSLFSGEYIKCIDYFYQKYDIPNFKLKIILILLSNYVLTILMTSSQFLSNEKNSGFFTQLLAGARDVFVTGFSYIFLKDFKATFNTVLGIIFSTLGAILISIKSAILGFYKNNNKQITSKEIEGDNVIIKEKKNYDREDSTQTLK